MGKNPAFQFYPGDWFREPGLRTACIVVRGCWAETLFTMHDSIPRGLLEYSVLHLARMWRVHPQVACYVVWELDRLGIADVEYQNEKTKDEIRDIAIDCACIGVVSEEAKEPGSYIGIPEGSVDYCVNQRQYGAFFVQLKSRRMYADWKSKENERLRGQERRKKDAVRKTSTKKPPPSSSSSSTSPSKNKEREKGKPSLVTRGDDTASCPHQEIIELYHEILPSMPKIRVWDETRQKLLRSRWKEDKERQSLAWWKQFFQYIASSDFLMGNNPKGWMADLEWLVKPTNFGKIANGRYHQAGGTQKVSAKTARNLVNLQAWLEECAHES